MTPIELVLNALGRAQAAGTLVILAVLILRRPARRLIGAQLAYRLWAAAPIAAGAAMFPSLAEFDKGPVAQVEPWTQAPDLMFAWIAGVILTGGLIALGELRLRRLARAGKAGPAVVGMLWPRMVTPADYETRFTPEERALIRRHEMTHIARGDPATNLFIAFAQALSWFNPLVHLACACARVDQELACDAAVIEALPACRKLYGATLIKAHIVPTQSLLACAWPAAARHPLETRLAMLARRPLTLPLYLRGAQAVAVVAVLATLAVWSLIPRWSAAPAYAWPPVYALPH